MRSNQRYRMTYDVDLVFCIDATMSMDPILDKVKMNTMDFYQDFYAKMSVKQKEINQLRVRVIAFRDYTYDKVPMLVSDFFTLPDGREDFSTCVRSIVPTGGGDDPEDGLEALAYAIKSNWSRNAVKRRHVIVLWSDDGTHEIGFGRRRPNYPKGMPKDFNELTMWWGSRHYPGLMDENAKRLLIFAPDKPWWSTIRSNWNNVIHVITEDNDKGLSKVEYSAIFDAICNSI